MLISIDPLVLENYPQVTIGYLIAEVSVCKSDPKVEALKQDLQSFLQEQNIEATTYVTHPQIAVWRNLYQQDFLVNPKTYRSSVEALLRRIITGKGLWNICNIVDLYNCCSVRYLLPMGGYDLEKVSGDITIRYGKEGETFVGLGERLSVNVETHHIVYADDTHILCWLWNHKDAEKTCIDEHSKKVIFFIDAFDSEKVKEALDYLEKHLTSLRSVVYDRGSLNTLSSTKSINQCIYQK
jgi:lysyl-tRNA synthetase class 2